jgi:hypothetical protein
MAKAKAKSRGRGAKGKGGRRGAKAVDIAGIRHAITRMVAHQAGEMVKAAIDDAKKGHSPAIKYLFEMIGLYPATAETEQAEKREMSLAELFCRELGLPTRAAEEETGEDEGTAASDGHAVE